MESSQRIASTGSLPHSPPKSPKKEVTRYGPVKASEIKFGSEERFQWQNSKNTSDVVYNLPSMTMSRSIVFSQATRKGMDDANPDAKKIAAGPGSYDYRNSFDFVSEYVRHDANRFPCAPRQSMAMKTPSPGAVYNIEKKYYTGPEKSMGIGFANASRQSLFTASTAANADLFIPRAETGPAITIAGRHKSKFVTERSPGPIYEVHKKVDFRTGPAYSFGRGKGDRFKAIGFLAERDE